MYPIILVENNINKVINKNFISNLFNKKKLIEIKSKIKKSCNLKNKNILSLTGKEIIIKKKRKNEILYLNELLISLDINIYIN